MLSVDSDWAQYLDMDRDPHIAASRTVVPRDPMLTPTSLWNWTLADATGIG